jgi:hypothetical protein
MKVIALESFTEDNGTFHPYGHEFEMDDTAERAEYMELGLIREDDRLKKTIGAGQRNAEVTEDELVRRRAEKAAKDAESASSPAPSPTAGSPATE